MSDSPFNFAPLGDQRDHHEHYTAGQRLNVEIGRLRQRESMLEAQIEVLELTIGKLRCVWDAAFMRDRIADVLERNADAIGQPYNLADAVLSAMHGWIDRLDRTLYDVIPPGDWGIVLEGDDA